ncbi:exopolysaccharide Pel transporter PelG [Pseudomonas sp. F1_0610]|uniref:exopolysaccharide Pel transporter PelG n=1 Tax=Pseudomonas sp. F1_0610 TaxID=3114284 RepID=UPI0039C1B8A6
MAGIGFQLRKILVKDTYSSTLRAYLYAGMISSGPWALSIISVMIIGLLSLGYLIPSQEVGQFLVSVTYLMASSLIFTGGLQLFFTRYTSDRLFENQPQVILPNLLGILLLITLAASVFGFFILALFFGNTSIHYKIVMFSNFIVLCNLWIVIIFLSGMKAYNRILLTMLIGYSLMIAASFILSRWKIYGLLTSLLIGHAVLLFLFLAEILRSHPSQKLIAFDFLKRKKIFLSLIATGFLYNLGIWVDKFIFWFNPATSHEVIGPLRSSLVYDLPIFLAYLSIIPGMAVFLVKIETDFAEWYEKLFKAVRDGGTLSYIEQARDEMTLAVRQGLFSICKIQGVTIILLLLFAPAILDWLTISRYHLPLFYIDVVGVSIQVVFMALLNVFFYLDKRLIALKLCFLFVLLNTGLTILSHILGPTFFGYGFTLSLFICVLVGLYQLSRTLDQLIYHTFMLRKG